MVRGTGKINVREASLGLKGTCVIIARSVKNSEGVGRGSSTFSLLRSEPRTKSERSWRGMLRVLVSEKIYVKNARVPFRGDVARWVSGAATGTSHAIGLAT